MASPFSASQRLQILGILGVPLTGSSRDIMEMGHRWPTISQYYPTWLVGDWSALITQVDEVLALCDADILARVSPFLSRWVEIENSPLIVKSSDTSSGTIVDRPAERENIRRSLCNALGLYSPPGGYYDYVNTLYGDTASVVASGAGDR